ncbi:MAG: hypothetical protein IJ501_00660 [Bacilli bacterium]|nr:hypothetical protein [Bacilli bacterium]
MFTKIYESIKEFIKKNYKGIILYLITLTIIIYPLPYYIYVGGGVIDLDKRIDLKGNETGSYNLAYVKQLNATIPTYLLSFIINTWDLEKVGSVSIDETETKIDIDKRAKLYLEEANNHAILNAYKLAGKEVNIKSNNYKVIYVNKDSDTNILVGDTLLSVNGILVSNNSEYKEYLSSLDLDSDLNVKVLRNNKEVDCYAKLKSINGEKVIGLYLVNIYDYEVDPKINLKFRSNESGPSGGFMLSLAIYDRLVSDDLTKGRKIVGTGTIDAVGNVGEIGGVKYKLMGAVKNKADIFFTPVLNYEEAMETKKKYNYDIEIISVKTLSDAIEYLENN